MILTHLEKVRDHGGGQFTALCPAHEDKSPSLSVKVDTDGFTLLHCFAGCTPEEVVNAVGMELRDLYPETEIPLYRKTRPRWDYKALLHLLKHEAMLVATVASDVRENRRVSDNDWEALKAAQAKIAEVVHVAG